MFRRAAPLLLSGLIVTAGLAVPPAPPAPETYNVQLRYQIAAFRTERLRQYHEMLKAFHEAGFVRDPDEVIAEDEPDNPKATRMSGTIAAKNVDQLLRERHVRSLLLYPKGTKLPEKDTRVRVDLRLSSGYLPEVQRQLARQTAEVLTKDAGFVEAVGYDGQGATRLVGSVPASQLEKLLEDVPRLPAAEDIGGALSRVSPIRATYVRPDWSVPSGRPKAGTVPDNMLKFTPELRELLEGDVAKRTRMEVILGWTPEESDRSWQRLLERAGAVVEGRIGPIVTVTGLPKEVAPRLAEMNEIAHVRLPRSGRVRPAGGEASPGWKPLRASGLADIHAMGRRGRGTRVAIVGDDFRGWEKLKGKYGPAYVDLTAERNRDLLPDPEPGPADGEGFGTRCARALIAAAPEADVTLVRIDDRAPYMLQTVAQAVNAGTVRTVALDQRLAELREDRGQLDRRAEELREERARIFGMSSDEENAKRLEAYRAKQAAYDKDDEAHRKRRDRYFRLLEGLQKLKGVRLVASTLVWPEGYPVDGSSALSRSFDDRPFKAALWFQAAGDTGGQAWAGNFRDADHNGVLEFAADSAKLPPGSWSPEINFLQWWPAKGKATDVLPAGARVRISLQWREAHDPTPLRTGEDPYRDPLTKFNLVVVRQPDPEGKTRPADDLDVVTTSVGRPVRLDQTLNAATYEQIVDLKIERPGRYGVFVEGRLPDSIQAPGEASLPATRRTGEVRPRLFVQTLEGNGRAAWTDYFTGGAAMGMPADARCVVTVGAAGEDGKVRPFSPSGSPTGLALARKPDVLAYDEGGGTAAAASFAAGFAASAWPLGGTVFGVLDRMHVNPGGVLSVPEKMR
jgi:hypothetical protein